MKRKSRTPNAAGYSLVELMISLVGASALIVGISGSIFLALKAADTSDSPVGATLDGASTLTDLMTDLEFAQSFSELTPNALTFTVPDRNSNSSVEIIRYAWSGTVGDPLTRQLNGGTVSTAVGNVHVFQHDLPTPNANLLSNSDMETGTTNWMAIPGATLSAETTLVHAGTGSLHASRNSGTDESGVRQSVPGVVSGTTYELSAWVRKLTAAAPYDAKLQLRVNSTGEGTQLFAIDTATITTTHYTQLKGTVTPTWTGSLLSAYWEATGIGNMQEIYVDDATLRIDQNPQQHVNVTLQVGDDSRSQIRSGVRLNNAPL